MGAKQFFSDPNKLRVAMVLAEKAANAALGMNISLPTAQLAETVANYTQHREYFKGMRSELLSEIKQNALSPGPVNEQDIKRGFEREKRASQAGTGTPATNTGIQPASKAEETVGRNVGATSQGMKSALDNKGIPKSDPAKGVKQRWAKLKAAQRKLKKPSKADVKKLITSVTSPVFMLTLGLAAVKDIIDFLSLGWLGTIVNIAVTTAFVAILLFQGSSMKKMKKRWIRYGIAALAEFIPFVSILPFWSGSVIWDKMSKK